MTRYRTLVRATLVQQSAWTGGGTQGDPSAQDRTIARDGMGRLTMTGSSLAGALVATAARIIPLAWDKDPVWQMVSGKRSPGRENTDYRQSVWRFHASHPEDVAARMPESRDGVGVRQKTGATALERGAKFDTEVLPQGARWPLFLEIDTETGGNEPLALALRALDEWRHGRCWLGASAARGLGRMKLENIEIVHLPLQAAYVSLWPDATIDKAELWKKLVGSGLAVVSLDQALAETAEVQLAGEKEEPWEYLEMGFQLEAGMQADGYGWNSLSTGGGPWLTFNPPMESLMVPPGMDPEKWKYFAAAQDHPVLVTAGGRGARRAPMIAGSSLRGTLRHTVSRLARIGGEHVDDPLAVATDQKPAPSDPAAAVFGWLDQDTALLVGDASSKSAPTPQLALLMMHAEDEFAAGVHASSLHNRTCVMSGAFEFSMVLEAPNEAVLREHLARLLPGIQAAASGQVPVGGAAWRGHGWIPWKPVFIRRATAGKGCWTEVETGTAPVDKLRNMALANGGQG